MNYVPLNSNKKNYVPLSVYLEHDLFFILLYLFYEIELILVKFLHDCYQIPMIQANCQIVSKFL